MNIIYTAKKVNPSEKFKLNAEKALQKIDKIFPNATEAKIMLKSHNDLVDVELTVIAPNTVLRAESTSSDMNAAFEDCVDTIIRKIRKNKTKLEKKIKTGSISDIQADLYSDDEEQQFDVIRTKKVSLKPESIEEAILQMNLLDHHFYVFINSETDKVSVVYRRKNGGYGFIEPA
ncbi:MAG: ribosome-associated translation inhibitor RaiA [Clostridia bacterium]|nr:ribosome-associated translation inhibitor RaiA [Clostridia bacterium]